MSTEIRPDDRTVAQAVDGVYYWISGSTGLYTMHQRAGEFGPSYLLGWDVTCYESIPVSRMWTHKGRDYKLVQYHQIKHPARIAWLVFLKQGEGHEADHWLQIAFELHSWHECINKVIPNHEADA